MELRGAERAQRQQGRSEGGEGGEGEFRKSLAEVTDRWIQFRE